jgi:hypothetical protein
MLQLPEKWSKIQQVQSFGCEDSVFNHLHMLLEVDKGKKSDIQK